MRDHIIPNTIAEILVLVRNEKAKAASDYRIHGDEIHPDPSRETEAKIRQALVDLAITARENVLSLLFPEVTAPTGTNMDPMKTKALQCRCGVCRPCWERELVAAAREERSPERPGAVL